MKIPSPRTIQTNINEERRMDIDNGIKLARKVDGLRETISELEQKHALFIEGTTTELQRRTEELSLEISLKEKQVKDLEQDRQKLLEPFVIKWEEVYEKEEQLIKETDKLNLLKKELTDYKSELDEREKNLSQEEERIVNLKKQIKVQVERVTDSSLQAQNTLLNAQEHERLVLSQLEEKTSVIVKKEKELSLRETNILTREEKLEEEEKEIINEKIRLADQRATLQRAMSRIQNK